MGIVFFYFIALCVLVYLFWRWGKSIADATLLGLIGSLLIISPFVSIRPSALVLGNSDTAFYYSVVLLTMAYTTAYAIYTAARA